MAPKYPVITQNSNKALNELKKLEGFGSELENIKTKFKSIQNTNNNYNLYTLV